MMMVEETRNLLDAKKAFEKRGHKATLVQDTDRYTVIDWKKADGGGDYYVNYIIDKKRGSLIISGDLGIALRHGTTRTACTISPSIPGALTTLLENFSVPPIVSTMMTTRL